MLENHRIRLIPPSMTYQPKMLEAIIESQVELSAFLTWVPYSLTATESVAYIKQAIENFNNFESELGYFIVDKAADTFLGCIGLQIKDKAIPYFEIGYWLRSSAVGKGYISDAVKLIERYAFDELNAKRLEIKTSNTNLRSYAVAERCGYRFEGELHNHRRMPNGELANTLVYAKTSL